LSTNEPYTIRDKYSQDIKILDAEDRQTPARLDDIIRICQNFHAEEQYLLKKLLQKYQSLSDGTLGKSNMEPITIQLMDPNFNPVHVLA
jgi:hypothetical protein